MQRALRATILCSVVSVLFYLPRVDWLTRVLLRPPVLRVAVCASLNGLQVVVSQARAARPDLRVEQREVWHVTHGPRVLSEYLLPNVTELSTVLRAGRGSRDVISAAVLLWMGARGMLPASVDPHRGTARVLLLACSRATRLVRLVP